MSKALIKISILMFLGMVLAILPLVGCGKEEKNTITIDTEEQLSQAITAAAEDMETYKFDMKYTLEQSNEIDEGAVAMKASAEISTIVDKTNRRIQITNNTKGESPPDYSFSKIDEFFIIGDMVYGRTTTSGVSGQWGKSPTTFEYWWEGRQNCVLGQLELFKASEIESFGSEEVIGIECWVINIIPNLEQLWEIGGRITSEELPTDLGECMKDISVKQWFAKDTYYLMRAELGWTVMLYGEGLIKIELECSHYNESVSIELPEEAEAAEGAE